MFALPCVCYTIAIMVDGPIEKKLIGTPPEQSRVSTPETAVIEREVTETKVSQTAEQKTESVDDKSKITELLRFKRKPTMVVPVVRDELTMKVEKILEEGVGDAYARLSPVAKQEFKLKGEEVARTIRDLLKSTHVKVKKIFQLIFEWLKILPGINRFFLEQEAKIKTDRIIELYKKKG